MPGASGAGAHNSDCGSLTATIGCALGWSIVATQRHAAAS
jgi:hypothetical protein